MMIKKKIVFLYYYCKNGFNKFYGCDLGIFCVFSSLPERKRIFDYTSWIKVSIYSSYTVLILWTFLGFLSNL